MQGHFEGKKHAIRQTQDGWVVSFVVHPNDMNPTFATAALGTRFMVGYAEIGDDETPAPVAAEPKVPDPDRSERARTTYRNLPPDKRAAADAGRYCTDPRFARFALERKGMAAVSGDPVTHTANWLRRHLGVESRGDIAVNPEARRKWEALRIEFEQWAGLMPEIRG